MTPEQFCYWMNGYVELNGDVPNEDQWAVIVEHLQTVFKKTTVLTVENDSLKQYLDKMNERSPNWGTYPFKSPPTIEC